MLAYLGQAVNTSGLNEEGDSPLAVGTRAAAIRRSAHTDRCATTHEEDTDESDIMAGDDIQSCTPRIESHGRCAHSSSGHRLQQKVRLARVTMARAMDAHR